MIDFVKVQIYDCFDKIRNHPDLRFEAVTDTETGECKVFRARYKGNLTFLIYQDNRVLLQGSIHKFLKAQNYDSPGIVGLWKALFDLSQHFGFDLQQTRLINLEWAHNVQPPIKTEILLERIYFHKKTVFSDEYRNYSYRCAFHSEYQVKAYDKGGEYCLRKPVFRFEIKYRKARIINKMYIFTLADLVETEKLEYLHNDLIKKWNELLLWEPEEEGVLLPPKVQEKLNEWKDINNWKKIKRSHRNKWAKEVNRYKEEYLQKLDHNVQRTIKQLFEETWCKFTEIQKYNERNEEVHFHNYKEQGICTPPPRRCQVTGLDISDQKEGSRFLSAAKVGEREAHRIRNVDSNARNKSRRRTKRLPKNGQRSLFN